MIYDHIKHGRILWVRIKGFGFNDSLLFENHLYINMLNDVLMNGKVLENCILQWKCENVLDEITFAKETLWEVDRYINR